MKRDKDPVFVDPGAVSPRRLSQCEMQMLAGGLPSSEVFAVVGTQLLVIGVVVVIYGG